MANRASETFSWMFAETDEVKGKLAGARSFGAKINPFNWNSGTAQEIFDVLSAASEADSTRPIRLKELGQRKWVDQGSIRQFESVLSAKDWINVNYLDSVSISLLTGAPAQRASVAQRASMAKRTDAGYGGVDVVQAIVGANTGDLASQVAAILDGKSVAAAVANDGTVPQLCFGDRRWEYQDLEGSWVPYEADVCKLLNATAAGSTVSVGKHALIEADGGAEDDSIELLELSQSHDMPASTRTVDEAAAANRWIWSWASDSGPGKHQDMWVPYEPHVCLRLETARKQGEQTIELDPDSPGVRHIDLTDPANIKQRVTGTTKWRRVKREAKASGAIVHRDGIVAKHHRTSKQSLGVRRADPMTIDDAIAWQACRDGNAEVLRLALRRGADPNFRGPGYTCGTLLHESCALGRVDCARLLLEDFGADDRAKDRQGKVPCDYLENVNLRYMQQVLEDVVSRRNHRQKDEHTKDDVAFRARLDAEGGDALKGWVIRFASESKYTNAIVIGSRDGPAVLTGRRTKELVLAPWNEADGRWCAQEPTEQHVEFNDELHYSLIRRATAAELTAAGLEHETVFEAHAKPVSVRFGSVSPDVATGATIYSLDVMIGDDCIHTISDRYRKLAETYTGKNSICSQYSQIKFPPKQNKMFAKLSESARASAEQQRKHDLRKFFEDILDVRGEIGMSVQQKQEIHQLMQLSEAASQMLIGIPESVPGATAPSVPFHETQQKDYTDWGVIAQLQTSVQQAKVASDLRHAYTIAAFAQVDAVRPVIAAVKERESMLLSMEQKKFESCRTVSFNEMHAAASDALRRAKACVKQADYEAAIAALRGGLNSEQMTQHVQTYPRDAHACNRWDLQLWLKVAKMRKHLAEGAIWKAVQQLQRSRDHPSMCWSLDVTGGTGLIDAVEECFLEMGVSSGARHGQLVDLRAALTSNITSLIDATRHQVGEINKVLNCLNSEVLRLGIFPEVVCGQPEPEPEPEHESEQELARHTANITAQQTEQMRSKYKKYWPEGQQSLNLIELGDILETIPGHSRPTDLELSRILHDSSSGPSPQCTVNASEFLDICSQQLDDADRELLEVFQIFDADGDGKITAVDLREVMKQYSQDTTGNPALDLRDSVVDEMMREGDTNGSGDISWTEFKHMIKLTEVDCSALDRTLELVTKQWTGAELEHFNLGPNLQATAQAIKAISRLCGYAACAKVTPLSEFYGPETSSSIKINRTRSGTELWCFAIVRQIICEHERDPSKNTNPTVSYALPGKVLCLSDECDINAALRDLLSSIEKRMDELTMDLRHRNIIRVNAVAGEAFWVTRSVGEALRHFERAFEHANEYEKAELQACLDGCHVELKRQKTVKGLHAEAIAALAQGNGARTAIARCASALRSEAGANTAEYDALHAMQQLAQSWDLGDVALAQWKGKECLKYYEKAKSYHEYIEGITPTEGYHGRMIRLGDSALEELKRCIEKAAREIDRKQGYVETMRLAEIELDEYRASDAEKKFSEALGIAEGRAPAFAPLCGPESESIDAKDGISRAQEELARQVQAKDLFGQAIAAVENCTPTKEWAHKPESDFVELWHEQLEGVELAIERCTEALQSVLSQEGRLKSQDRTPERKSLEMMIAMCKEWKLGSECMLGRQGHKALDHFQSASDQSAEAAAKYKPTVGYYGARIALSDNAQQVLQACIESANREIRRQQEKGAIDQARRSKLGGGAANEAVQQAKLERDLARTAEEIAEAERKIQEAEQNLARQEGVKELHKKATDALKQNDPDTALQLYNQAIDLAAPDAAAGLSEVKSLEHMKSVSQLWIEGKMALQRWDGATAQAKFKECRDVERILDEIEPTAGYAGNKIKLGLASAELKRCEGYAHAENERNCEFKRLIAEGREALRTWKAEHALQCFAVAGDHKHARFVLKYVVAKQSVIRPENKDELETVRLCMQQAKAELTRQNEVKTAFKECVRNLEANTHACEVSFDASPAIQRCLKEATSGAEKACQQAISRCLCDEGMLESQRNIPEHNALEEIQLLVAAWKLGDEKLAAWDGKGALSAYQTADGHASSAVDIMKRPTEGYLDATSVKIELTTAAADALQRCISEATNEIARKGRFDEHIRLGADHLSKLQAMKAHERFTQADQEKMNDRESKHVCEMLQQATEEKQRQSKFKEHFYQARKLLHVSRVCDDLVKRRAPEQLEQFEQHLTAIHKDVQKNLSSAFEQLSSTEGRLLRSHEGEPEHAALQHMEACCKSWQIADERLVARDGPRAHVEYSRALQCANLAKELEPTPGYIGEKIELGQDAQDFLDECIRIAGLEINRKRDFLDTIERGDQQLRHDRAPFHLKLQPVQSYSSSEMVDRSRCEADGCQAPDIAHAGMCNQCVWCQGHFSPVICTVHCVNSSKLYASAYEIAMSDTERDTAMAQIASCVDKLQMSLKTERAAYNRLAQQAVVNFDERKALACLFDRDFAILRAGSRGPETTLSALTSLASWRRDAETGAQSARITAEHISGKLDDAITAILDMHASNDKIRGMEKQKISESRAPSAAPEELEVVAEGDGDEEDSADEAEVHAVQKPETPLEELEMLRDKQREAAIQRGREYEETAVALLEQKKSVQQISKELRLGVLGLQRLHRAHDFASDRHAVMRAWLVAGASESWSLEKEKLNKTAPSQLKQAQLTAGSLKFQTDRKVGLFGTLKTVLFEADVSLDGGRLTVTTKPTADDIKYYKEVEETHVIQLAPEFFFQTIADSTVDTRSKAVGEIKNKVHIKHAFRVTDGSDSTIVLVANDDDERAEWCRKLTRKLELIAEGALVVVADPEPEEEPAEVTVESECLSRSQVLASQAIDRFQNWQASTKHSAPHEYTDAGIQRLQNQVDQVRKDVDWIKSAPAAAEELKSCLANLQERVQAERALREIRPADSLRAAIWGVGEKFPQLCARELIDTSSRYLAAQGRYERSSLAQSMSHPAASGAEQLREAQRTFGGIKDRQLQTAVLGVLGEDVTDSFFELAASSSEMLKEELRQLEVTEHRARDNNVVDETDGAARAKAQGRPDTSEFERLEELRFTQKTAFNRALLEQSELKETMDRYATNHSKYPSLKDIREVETNVTKTRRALRETSKQINKEMTILAEAGSDHWPEVLVRLPKVGEFKQMDFIRSGDLTMESYENVEPLSDANSRNNVFTATLDGNEVVLKQYDLTKADEVTAVLNEVTQLHKMRHPNIVEINGVFDEIKRGKTNMYLQMPKYSGDLLTWLRDNPTPDAQQRRQILLGVLRGVARVHEFNFTHNDIKLENVLLDRRTRKLQAVLCDFEMLKEETTLAIDGTVTTVGGTVAYMAPERFTKGHRPDKASDMFSVGVLMLFCFAPDRIEDVCRNKEDKSHVPPQTVLSQVRDKLPDAVRDGIKGLLQYDPGSRPSARSFLGTTDSAGKHQDTYFTRAEMELPTYWNDAPAGSDEQLIEVADDVLQILRYTVAPQTRAEFGKGIDAGIHWSGIPDAYRDIEVVKAWRIQNEPLWKQYSAARERVADDVSRGPAIDSNSAPVCNRVKMMKPKQSSGVCSGCSAGGLRLEEAAKLGFVRREGQEVEDSGRFDVNETFLLHGIPKSAVADVLLTGMDERYSGANKGTLFGAGSYFAQDIEKADQYNGEPDHGYGTSDLQGLHQRLYPNGAEDHPGDVVYVLVCRVVLGYAIRTKGRANYKNPRTGQRTSQCVAMDPDVSANNLLFVNENARQLVKLKGYEQTGVHFHSLLAETERGGDIERFREFVVFDGKYTYPEFLLAYKRKSVPPDGMEPEPEPAA